MSDIDSTAREHRLHPWSWLFVLIQQLKQFIFPLIVLVFFGARSGRDEWWQSMGPLIAMVVLVLIAIARYFTYRYRIGQDGLTIRSGWLERSVREIPFARIHNVGIKQTLLHRLFGVAEVRLESAGGQKPEAEMRVLSLAAAADLEDVIRHRGRRDATQQTDDDANVPPPLARPADTTLLALPLGEVLRLGLISNRGMIIVAAAFGAIWQVFPERQLTNTMIAGGRQAFGYATHAHWSWLQTGLAGLALVVLFLLATRLLSIGQTLLQYYGFRLSQSGERITVERGLLARLRTSVVRRRIQSWTLHEGVVHRLLRRRSLRVDTAVASRGDGGEERSLKVLAPVARPEAVDALVHQLLPDVWPPQHWQGWSGQVWWRLWWPRVLWTLALALLARHWLGAWGWLVLLWLPFSAYALRQQVRHAGHAVGAQIISVRGGWWSRWWRFAEIDKLQALRLTRSPIDRWCGTATLWLDTAGDSGFKPPLRLRFLPQDQAHALYAELGRALAHRRLHW
ncbi:PH domain-containing protein [Pseudoxanthomonas indica]|uniref:Putative membrane protein n=3 Tax=Pseudoxanthomonas indica TaxID=428993 RepID=A0A1T5KDB0_9GAMM|nr:PH domain-containing protein [Pseudoxanthomonas indica]SKC61686.1 putative membrane protein [Pseudoxanthomonas indica]